MPDSPGPAPKTGAEWIGTRLDASATFLGIRAKTMQALARLVAELPDGKLEPLIWFYRYDPKFARTYYFRKPLKLPAGMRIVSSVPGVTVALIEPAR